MNKNDNERRTLIVVTSFVFEALLILGMGYLGGYYLDEWLNTSPLFIVILMILSVFVAVYNLIRKANKVGNK